MDWQSRHTGTNLHVHRQQGEGKDNFFVFFLNFRNGLAIKAHRN